MANLHELIMGNAFKAFIENAQAETQNAQQLALYSAKLAQERIAKEQESEATRERKIKSQKELIAMPIPENTDRELTYGISDAGDIDVKATIKSKKDTEEDALDKEIKRELALAKLRESSFKEKLLGEIASGEGADSFPPGTTINVGGINIPVVRKYTSEETKDLSSSDSLMGEIVKLKELIMENPKSQITGSLPFGLGTESGQRFALLKKSIGERLLRLRSGAQINPEEYKRFMEMLPAATRHDTLDIEKLNEFYAEFESIQGRILSGSRWDEKNKTFTAGVASSTQHPAGNQKAIYANNPTTGQRLVSTDGGKTWQPVQ